ncbi:MAG: hypothetical protein GX907_04790 [Clostridiaceae bacterium]|nr:hypothetical protein [Clostridiaceae bacterium]
MKSKHIKWIGFAVLLITVAAIIVVNIIMSGRPDQAMLKGYLGGEKIGIFEDEEIGNYIKKTYGLTLNYQKAGSYDMMSLDHSKVNYLFPASQSAFEYYKTLHGKTPKNDIIYNTPLVIYSRTKIVEALQKEGIVFERNGVFYLYMDKLADLMLEGKTWADVGLPELYGSVLVDTTDPASSNSGNMFAALLANTINGGNPVNQSDLATVVPKMQTIYSKYGFMETSSADMFNQFLKKGPGANPLVAAYENQLLEFAVNEPKIWEAIKDDIVIIYPIPTMWSSHVYIALDEVGERGMRALADPKVQELSWLKHGFRAGAKSAQETGRFNVAGVAPEISAVTQMPTETVLNQLIARIR